MKGSHSKNLKLIMTFGWFKVDRTCGWWNPWPWYKLESNGLRLVVPKPCAQVEFYLKIVCIYIIINIIRWLLLLNINCSRAPCRSIPCFDHRLRHEGLSKMGLYVYGLIKYIDRRTLQKPLHPSSWTGEGHISYTYPTTRALWMMVRLQVVL